MTAPAVARFCGGNPDGAWEQLNVQVLLLRDFRLSPSKVNCFV
jgi:hypothetical protein